MKNSRRAAAASALMLALAAWLGGAADSVLLAAHRALSANLGPTARAWDRDREGQSAENSSTTQGGRATAVILGYALSPDGQAGPGLAARARTGADLYAAGAVTALICSGGHPGGGLRGGTSEAAAAAAVAATHLDLAAPPPAWRLEEASTSTWENALFSLRMVTERESDGASPAVVVVTSPFHLGRAARTFAAAAAVLAREGGRAPLPIFAACPALAAPATPADRVLAAYEAVREVAALAWYWVRGRLA